MWKYFWLYRKEYIMLMNVFEGILIPAIKQSENMGTLSFVPAVFRDIEACSYTIPESNGYASMAALSSCYGGTDCRCVLWIRRSGESGKRIFFAFYHCHFWRLCWQLHLEAVLEINLCINMLWRHQMKWGNCISSFMLIWKKWRNADARRKRYSDWRKKHEKWRI